MAVRTMLITPLSILMVSVEDPALVAYIQKVDKRFRDELDELNPWWMLNVMQIVDRKGEKISVGACAFSLIFK